MSGRVVFPALLGKVAPKIDWLSVTALRRYIEIKGWCPGVPGPRRGVQVYLVQSVAPRTGWLKGWCPGVPGPRLGALMGLVQGVVLRRTWPKGFCPGVPVPRRGAQVCLA